MKHFPAILGRAASCLGLGVAGLLLVAHFMSGRDGGEGVILTVAVLVAFALLAGWGARTVTERPLRAGLLSWLAAIPFGFIMLAYGGSNTSTREFMFILMAPPALFMLSGLVSMVEGISSSRRPPPKDPS